MAAKIFEVVDKRWYTLVYNGSVLRLHRGEGRPPDDIIAIKVGLDVVVSYPVGDPLLRRRQVFAFNESWYEDGANVEFAWVMIDLGLDTITLRLRVKRS